MDTMALANKLPTDWIETMKLVKIATETAAKAL